MLPSACSFIVDGSLFTRKGKHTHKNQTKNTNGNMQERATKAAKQIPSGI
jgi:hypothetical protein